MRVFVTGGTGFIGAHSARALLQAGHAVRLLVRNPVGVADYYARFGHDVRDLVVADMRDAATLRPALRDCDAVLHAAALVSVDPRRNAAEPDANLKGAQAVLGTAADLGIDRILHVSSLSVFAAPAGGGLLDEEAPLAAPADAYARSKVACETFVRGLQQQGVPVRITYPVATFGPDDPRLGQSMRGLCSLLRQVPLTSTGLQCVDVRDLALAHRLLLEAPAAVPVAGERYIVGGRYYAWADFHRLLCGLVGRPIPGPRVPGVLLRGAGTLTDVVRRLVPFDSQFTAEAMGYVTRWVPARSDRLLACTGLRFRRGEETFADAIHWLAAAGHVGAREAGRLAAG